MWRADQYWPSAADLEAVLEWTAHHAPSPLARVIAGIAQRNPDLSIGGIRNRTAEKQLYGRSYSVADLDRAFTADRALMVDASYDFEAQVLRVIFYLEANPPHADPDKAFSSNIVDACGRTYRATITLGAVAVAALACGYTIDDTFAETDREIMGDAFFDVPDVRSPPPELCPPVRP
jgi:hypothetical protein